MAKAKRHTTFAGAGCFLQGLGLLALVGAALTLRTLIGPIVLGILGLWLLVYGSQNSQWWGCSECGTRLANKRVKVCPSCQAELR